MDYRYLKAFILTAKYSSFSKAADDLNIAQSAVSRQIRLLEESVGEELIIRSSKKVILTDKGEELFLSSIQFDDFTRDLFTKDSHKTIRIGVLDGLLENWLNNVIIKFYKKFTNNIKIVIGYPLGLKNDLAQGKLDIIFTTENIQSELISSLKLFEEKLVLISRQKVDLNKIQEKRWITFNEEDHFFQLYKKHSQEILMVDSMTSIVNLVKNNIGVAIVPDHALKTTDNLVSQAIKGPKKSEIYMATLSYKNMPKYLKELTQIISQAMKKI